MAKFQITRKRILTQMAVFEIEVEDGSPLTVGETVNDAELDWKTENSIALSTEVMPLPDDG